MASASTAPSSADLALLQSFPASTSPASAAHAISRAVSCSLHGTLPSETLAAARAALNSLSESPAEGALPGLVDAVEKGASSSCVDAFVLTAGAWRAILGLASLVRDAAFASRILSTAAVSSLAVLTTSSESGGAPAVRRLRIARFHAANGARCSRAFCSSGLHDGDGAPHAAAAACDLFGAVAERIAREGGSNEGLRALAAPTAAFLTGSFRLLDEGSWVQAFRIPTKQYQSGSESIPRRALAAIYLIRIAHPSSQLDDFNAACMRCLKTTLLPLLFELCESQALCLLQYHYAPSSPSLATLISASAANAAVQLDMGCSRNDSILNFLLLHMSSPSAVASCIAARSIEAVIAARGPDHARKGFAIIHEAFLLADALQSPHVDERWVPLCFTIALKLRARGFGAGLPEKFIITSDCFQSDLNTVFSPADSQTWIKSNSLPRLTNLLSVHGNRIAPQFLSRLQRSANSLSAPPVELSTRLAECALGAAKMTSIPGKAASIHHATELTNHLPVGIHRNKLITMLASVRGRDKFASPPPSGTCATVGGILGALTVLGKSAASKQSRENASPNFTLYREVEKVSLVVENVKTLLNVPEQASPNP